MASGIPHRQRFVTIGAGAVATALAPALRSAGYEPVGVLGRDADRALDLANALRTRVVTRPPEADLYALCVPDDRIGEVVERLVDAEIDWDGRVVLHLAGAMDASVLDPVAERGATTLAFHPVQTFVFPSSPGVLEGISVGISGDENGREAGVALASRLGLDPIVIRDADRPLYHLATVLVSNGAVTLSAMAGQILRDCGVEAAESRRLLAPLVTASAENLVNADPETVLTGPVVRGDAASVERHLAALSAAQPFLVPAVAALTTETVWLAVRSGRLDPGIADRVLAVIERFVAAGTGFREGEEP